MKSTQFNLTYTTSPVLLLIASLWFTNADAGGSYKFSVTPRFSAQEILNRFGPLTTLLSEKLHNPVEIVLASDFDDYETRLKAGQFDIAFSNPSHYSKASATNEVIAIGAKNDEARVRGLIITRTDSNIKSIQDLVGQNIAIVSWDSTFGFLSQKVFLEEQGINPKTQLKLQEAHDNKQENVILSVYHGDVVAGFINEDSLNIVDRYVPPGQIRIVTATAWLPDWGLSVKRVLPQMVKARIRQAVLEISANDLVLQALKLQSFVAATDADYDLVRKALEIEDLSIVTAELKPAASPPCAPNQQIATVTTVAPTQPATTTSLSTTVLPLPVPIPTKLDTNATANATNTNTSSSAQSKPIDKKTNRKRKGKSKRS